jgi:hypothetical protein
VEDSKMKKCVATSALLLVVGFSIIFMFGSTACSNQKDHVQEIARVEKAIHSSIGWAKDKNLNLLYSVIANDSNFIEVHPNNRVVKGINEFKKAEKFWCSPDFKAIRYEIRDLKIQLSNSGEVAWFYCVLDDINEWQGQPANWENTRWTGVLEKRAGNWVMVQQHFSFASKD